MAGDSAKKSGVKIRFELESGEAYRLSESAKNVVASFNETNTGVTAGYLSSEQGGNLTPAIEILTVWGKKTPDASALEIVRETLVPELKKVRGLEGAEVKIGEVTPLPLGFDLKPPGSRRR